MNYKEYIKLMLTVPKESILMRKLKAVCSKCEWCNRKARLNRYGLCEGCEDKNQKYITDAQIEQKGKQ